MTDEAVIVIDASDVGYKPGSFPRVFKYHGDWFEISHPCHDNEGDLMYVEYHPTTEQHPSQVVRIFND